MYDIFICYKQSEDSRSGEKTEDYRKGRELYYDLKDEGFSVFFSDITLKNYCGQDYEKHIFSALHSAKIMLVIGTRADYFTSDYVKKEWTQYLRWMDQGERKVLIPLYKWDYRDLPWEFQSRNLQGIDLSSNRASLDVIRAVKQNIGSGRRNEENTDVSQKKRQ